MSDKEKVVNIRKSFFNAKTTYEYRILEMKQDKFIDCNIVEQDEELEIHYDVSGVKNAQAIRKEKYVDQLLFLIDIASLHNEYLQFLFSLQPDNLYFDIYNKAKICHRDMRCDNSSDTFLVEYKALVGYTLQKKYSFEDYLQGGLSLLSKEKLGAKVFEAKTIEEVKEVLLSEYKKVKKASVGNVDIASHKLSWMKRYCVITVIFFIVGILGASAYYFKVAQKREALVGGYEAYIISDYISVIDSMRTLNVTSMNNHALYILSTSYVKAENLTDEQKENILLEIDVNNNSKILQYWVYLGRNDAKSAENCAKQLSREDLLLYAYMKEKLLLEKNTEISGDVKEKRLDELDTLISEISDKYTEE